MGALETILVREKPVLLYMEVFTLIIDLRKVFGVSGYLKPHWLYGNSVIRNRYRVMHFVLSFWQWNDW
jgi:hypothetical protein